MTDYFTPPETMAATGSAHHTAAAARNAAVADDASRELADILSGVSPVERILLKAAAGAGKSGTVKYVEIAVDPVIGPRSVTHFLR